MKIDSFSGKYRWLSNFHECEVVLDGVVYPSTEAAYQAAKTLDLKQREEIRLAAKPGDAKKLGRKVTMRPDWETAKVGVMEDLCRQKFTKYSDLKDKLLETGDDELIEGNHWNDRFWGVCKGVGLNHLGKILMKIRADLKLPSSPS